MRIKYIILILSIFTLIFNFGCKTTESTQPITPPNELSQEDLLQSKIDTSSAIGMSTDELRRITLMAQSAGKLYCKMKQFEGKDRKDIEVAKAYDPLDLEYRNIQHEVNKLGVEGKREYERIFDETRKKCE